MEEKQENRLVVEIIWKKREENNKLVNYTKFGR